MTGSKFEHFLAQARLERQQTYYSKESRRSGDEKVSPTWALDLWEEEIRNP
jgi:hypothetical protein